MFQFRFPARTYKQYIFLFIKMKRKNCKNKYLVLWFCHNNNENEADKKKKSPPNCNNNTIDNNSIHTSCICQSIIIIVWSFSDNFLDSLMVGKIERLNYIKVVLDYTVPINDPNNNTHNIGACIQITIKYIWMKLLFTHLAH